MPRKLTFRPLTAAQLDALSEYTPEDILRGRAAWRRHAPAAGRALLDAQPTERSSADIVVPELPASG